MRAPSAVPMHNDLPAVRSADSPQLRSKLRPSTLSPLSRPWAVLIETVSRIPLEGPMSTRQKVWLTVALFIGVLMYGGNEALAVLVGDGTHPCPGATITAPGGIQTAVTAATTAGPTTIQVCPGTYTAVTI